MLPFPNTVSQHEQGFSIIIMGYNGESCKTYSLEKEPKDNRRGNKTWKLNINTHSYIKTLFQSLVSMTSHPASNQKIVRY